MMKQIGKKRSIGLFWKRTLHSSQKQLFEESEKREPPGFGKVKIFISSTNDPYVNLATEDWMFRNLDLSTPVLFLWRNKANVVIGEL